MANEHLLSELRKGPDHWNAWLRENWSGISVLDFTGANLRDAQLPGVELLGANLVGADLAQANLVGAKLTGARCAGADFSFANLNDADMEVANLVESKLVGTRLERAILHMAQLDQANLEQARLVGSILQNASMTKARLARADLTDAKLKSADLTDAVLDEAILNGADLRRVTGMRFDSNDIRGTRFTVRPMAEHGDRFRRLYYSLFSLSPTDDPWSLLRRDYTGANLVLTWLALLVFLLPRILTAVGLYLLSASERVTSDIVRLVNDHPRAPQDLVQSIDRTIEAQEDYPVWQVVLGVHQGGVDSFAWAALVLVLFLYTLGRFYLTLRVVPLRDAESRSGKTPARGDYETIFTLHRLMQPIGGVAFLFFLFNAWRLLSWLVTSRVSLP